MNPFHFGSPLSPSEAGAFCDREAERDVLVRAMREGRSAILLGPRRYGKTSLLQIAGADAAAGGARTGRVTLIDCIDLHDVCESLLQGILRGPARWQDRGLEWVRTHLAALHPRLTVRGDGELEIGLETLSASAARRRVGDVLRVLGEVAEEGPVSLVIDEFQVAFEIDESVPGLVKRISDELPGVGLILSGSRRHLMERLSSGRGAPLARIGTTIALGRIPEHVMVDFLMRRATEGRKMLSEQVAASIYREARGIPNEVQQLAAAAFDLSARRIRDENVVAARDQIIRLGGFEYLTLFRSLSTGGKRLLRELARSGPVAHPQSGEMVRRLQMSNPSAVRFALRSLEEEDLVEQTEVGWDVSNPFFAAWLRGTGIG